MKETQKQLPDGIGYRKGEREDGRNILWYLNILAHKMNIYLQPNILKVFYMYYHLYSLRVDEAAINIYIYLKKLGSDRLKYLSKASH